MRRPSNNRAIIATLRTELVSLRSRVSEIASQLELTDAQLEAARVEIAALRAENAELKARSGKDSSNSSKPPSTDHPHRDRQRGKGKSASGFSASPRRRGGQPGHPGHQRLLVPVEEVDEVVPCIPRHCGHCQRVLARQPQPGDPKPRREQVWELPPIRWEITEFLRHGRICAGCGHCTWGERPVEAPVGDVGFRGQAALGLLTGGAQLSRRIAVTLARELLNFPISLGGLSRVEARVGAALAAPCEEIAAAVAAAPVVHCDETPWREPGSRPWLWTATTGGLALFRIAASRCAAAFAALLPANRDQIKVTDRYTVYVSALTQEEHAVCWGHLDRDFRAWAQQGGVAGAVGRWLGAETQKLFGHWHAFRGGEIDRTGLQERLAPVRDAVHAALRWGADSGIKGLQGMCHNLLDREETLWTFARVEGVEPTNNVAERAVRPGVLWRKTSLFTQSIRGREYVARMLTARTTVRRQGGNLLEFLTDALRAAQTGQPAPPLLKPDT